MPTYPKLHDVLKFGSKNPCVVINVSDCRAACVDLRGRDWQSSETTVGTGEPTFGISVMTELDGDFAKVLGRFRGQIEARITPSVNRDHRQSKEYVMLPMPGTAPPTKKRRRGPLTAAIEDDGIGPVPVVDLVSLMKRGTAKLNAIVNGQSAATENPGE